MVLAGVYDGAIRLDQVISIPHGMLVSFFFATADREVQAGDTTPGPGWFLLRRARDLSNSGLALSSWCTAADPSGPSGCDPWPVLLFLQG